MGAEEGWGASFSAVTVLKQYCRISLSELCLLLLFFDLLEQNMSP